MENFYITFASKYQHEEHPVLPEITNRSYVVIKAYSEEEARQQAFDTFDQSWAFLYTEDEFEGQVDAYNLIEVEMIFP